MATGVVVALMLSAGARESERPAPPGTLTVRNAHAMAYDEARGRVVLFGGADAERVCGDTWEWDGKRWTQVSTTGPGPRTFPVMIYDSVRRVTLLFGGNRVLFGAKQADAVFLDDLWQWVWDGTHWSQASTTGPSPRNGAALAYDQPRDRVVLFGGRLVDGGGAETWEWDGHAWRRNDASPTDGRFNPALAFDAVRRRVLRFGGWNGKERTGDTWEYDGHSWTRRATIGPAARNHSALVFDQRRKRAVLFGGHNGSLVFGDLWEWDGVRWQQRLFTQPQPRLDNGH